MNAIAIIPARYASTRFPGKPLVNIGGKTMIQHVYERAKSVPQLTDVIVATEDERIYKQVESFGGKAMMTAKTHQSGTERCAEVVSKIDVEPDVVLNVQGDVPFINISHIQQVLSCFQQPAETQIATLMVPITTAAILNNTNAPKVIFDKNYKAIYFSRSPIPHIRDAEREDWHKYFHYYKHIGIYGFRADVLKEIVQLPVSLLERAENLEQLRWIENGYSIQLAETAVESLAIDTPEDLSRVLAKMQGSKYLE